MKKKTILYLTLAAPFALWAQADVAAPADVDLSDVVVIEESSPSVSAVAAPTVVEIPDAAIDGASLDTDQPNIPAVTTQMPTGTEVVLDIPGQDMGSTSVMATAETITVDFPDEDVRTILRNVADLFDLNLVIPDTLQGRTSLKLSNITWRQVFEVVLEPLGFTYVEDRNIIRIKSLEELTAEPVDTRVFIVNHAVASEISGSIGPLVDPTAGGRIQVDIRSNALVITERPSRMNKIQDIVERLDQPNHQVMIESKFVEVSDGDEFDLGVNWAFTGNQDSNNNLSPGRGIRSGETFVETTPGVPATLGTPATPDRVVTNSLTGDMTFIPGTPAIPGLPAIAPVLDFVDPLNGRGLLAVFSRNEFAATLSALDEKSTSELVSNPTVVVMNNQAAKFEVGVDYPIREVTFNPETGRTEAGEVTKEFIGIDLDVTPSVNAGGMISLKVNAELSQLGGAGFGDFVESIGGLDPIISKRKAITQVTIKDGYTIALGGLTAEVERTSNEGIPGLMNLPIVGNLFKQKSETSSRSNLIIFITARTLNPDGTDYREIIDPRVLEATNHAPSKVPGYDLPARDREALAEAEAARAQLRNTKMHRNIAADKKEAVESEKTWAERLRLVNEPAE
jgi:type IV pilus assembly protein PilQ